MLVNKNTLPLLLTFRDNIPSKGGSNRCIVQLERPVSFQIQLKPPSNHIPNVKIYGSLQSLVLVSLEASKVHNSHHSIISGHPIAFQMYKNLRWEYFLAHMGNDVHQVVN